MFDATIFNDNSKNEVRFFLNFSRFESCRKFLRALLCPVPLAASSELAAHLAEQTVGSDEAIEKLLSQA
jgi:hypothetical protein